MPEVNFYLKKAKKGVKTRVIYLAFHYNKKRFTYSFGQRVAAANWNEEKQRVKNKLTTTADGQYALNDLLDKLAKLTIKSYHEELVNGIPLPATLKSHLDAELDRNKVDKAEKPTLFGLIKRFEAGEILFRGRAKSQGSLNNYRAVKLLLEDFEKKKAYKVDFETVTLDFFYAYTDFLKRTKKLAVNTIGKDINLLKVFMGEAVDLGYTTNMQFRMKKFTVQDQETDATALKESEIMKLYRHDFSGHKKLEAVRDLFVFGCFCGLRQSDFSNIQPENIIETDGDLFIKIITQKTGELVIIPTNPIIREIFAKYSGNSNRLPRAYSNQKFNDYIKEACKKAGLDEVGRLSTDPKLVLWETVSSHTARRSFATNL